MAQQPGDRRARGRGPSRCRVRPERRGRCSTAGLCRCRTGAGRREGRVVPLPRWAVVPASSSATIRPAPASITSVVDAARLRVLRRRPELTEVPLSDPMEASSRGNDATIPAGAAASGNRAGTAAGRRPGWPPRGADLDPPRNALNCYFAKVSTRVRPEPNTHDLFWRTSCASPRWCVLSSSLGNPSRRPRCFAP